MELHTRLRACWDLCDRGTRIFEAKLAKWMRRAGEPLTKPATNWGSQFSSGERLRCQGTLMLAPRAGKKQSNKISKLLMLQCECSDCADPHQVNKRIIPVPGSRRGRPMGDQHGRCFVPEL
ncbi:hypothetical protein ASPBRDRAFT_71824 [Aspergillus brasiliensis CBS 101740]|uniref:Uncharacterized protein n=1 Tax=Aspergillus brasiliensis (strain CBS 101740 / IMI 381727 / IBT 21946) TaxID=767769 RepID=A0A1L9UVG9_ASPBC|nr:hypothetical protein ASPBRDRAFT_71824 [Aspergillus brasiliensis CBS 101740]